MADLTYTVTVASGTLYITGGTGNVYYLDGARNMDVKWVKGATIRFEQSDSSNNNHPLLFTTSTSNPNSNIISSGVTYYLDGSSNQAGYTNVSTFNAASTRYVEITPASESDFHYYCYVHGIGMGGAIDITQNTWGALSWGQNNWNAQNNNTEILTGVSMSVAQGELAAFPENGWGHSTWGSEPWGESFSPVVPLSGVPAMAMSVGTFDYAQSIEGWGRDEWGIGGYGTNTTTVEVDGLTMDMGQGPEGWGVSAWGDNNWGGELIIKPESVVGLTGVSMSASVGSTTQTFDMNFDVTGVSDGVALGVLNVDNLPDHSQGLGSVTIGSAIGSVVNQQSYDVTGISISASLNNLTIDDTQLVTPGGVTIGSSIGSVDTDNLIVGLVGVSMGSTVGSTTVEDMTVGLTGLDITSNLGLVGFGALAYKDIDITATTTYTDITHAA